MVIQRCWKNVKVYTYVSILHTYLCSLYIYYGTVICARYIYTMERCATTDKGEQPKPNNISREMMALIWISWPVL